jgi:hypothetical protein
MRLVPESRDSAGETIHDGPRTICLSDSAATYERLWAGCVPGHQSRRQWGRISRQAHSTAFFTVRRRRSRFSKSSLQWLGSKSADPQRSNAVAQRSLLVSKCTPGAKDADHTVIPWQHWLGAKVRGNGQMISAVECREHAVECRQMSERAPSPRVRDILIDLARSWERLALETEHSAPTSAKLVLRHQFRREL